MNLRRVLVVLFASSTLAACNCGGGGDGPDANNNQVATQLAFTVQPPHGTAGQALAPALQVAIQDEQGQVVSTADGTVTLALGANPGAGTLSGTLSANVVAGVATFSGVNLDKAAVGYSLTASAPGLTGATSSPFDIGAGSPSRLVFVQEPSEVESGAVIAPPVLVRVEDAFGNLAVSTDAVSISLADNPGADALQGNTQAVPVDGVATFTELVLDVAAEGYTLAAGSGSLVSARSRPFTVRPGLPTQLAFTVQPPDGVAGEALAPPVQVEIRDGRGNRVKTSTATVSLAFASNPGSAVLGGTFAAAAVDGVASFAELTVDRSASGYSLQATSGTLTGATSASFSVAAGAPASIAFLVQPSDTGSQTPIGPAVEVALYDALGNLSSSSAAITLTLQTAPPGATLGGTTTRNGVGGVARFNDLQVDLMGQYTLRATASALSGTSASFSVAHGAPASLAFTQQPTDASAGALIAPAVSLTVEDAAGNVATSYSGPVTVVLQANAFGAVLTGVNTVVPVNGVASFAGLSIAKAGTGFRLGGSTGTLTPITSAPFAIIPGAATQLVFAQGPTDVQAGAAISPAVQVALLDAQGNVSASSATISLTLGANPAGGALGGTTSLAASSGLATFSGLSLEKAGTGYALTASTSGLPDVTSGTFTVTAAAASKLTFTAQPVTTTLGGTLPEVRVAVRDAYDNTASGYAGSITLALATNPSGGTLGGTLTRPVAGGEATFADLSVDAAGSGYSLGATSGSLIGATSTSFDIVVGAPAALVFTGQPSDTVAGGTLSPAVTVTVRDAGGNTVTSFNGSISLAQGAGSPAGAVLSGTTSVSASSGVATFANLSLDKAGTGYSLVASGASLAPVTSSTFAVSVGAASQLVFAQPPTNSTAGAAISPAIRVELRDAAGNLLTSSSANVTLALGNNPGGSTLSGTKTRAAVSGVATFNDLSLDRVGSGYTLVATSGALPSSESASFSVAAGTASQLVFIQQPSDTLAGAAITPAVSVAVRDASGNTVTSFSGTLTVALGAGSPAGAVLAGTTSVTLASGVGTFADLSIAQAGSGYSLQAAVSGLSPVISTLFAIQVGGASKLVLTQQPTNVGSGSSISPSVVAEVQDTVGNRVASTATVTVAFANNPTGAVLSGTLSRAAVGGVVTFNNLSVDLAGTGYTLLLSSGGLTPATSAAFNVSAGAAARLAFTQQPSGTSAGSFLGIVTVEVQDAAGNRITGSSAAVGLTISGGAVLTGTTPRNAVGGVASFGDLAVETAGSGYTLTASSSGLSNGVSALFSITAAAPARMVFAQQPSTIVAGAPFTPAVAVRFQDAFGNATANATAVTLAFANDPSGTGSLLGTSTVTSAAGLATFSGLSVNRTGTGFTLQASSAVGTPITSVAFNVSPAAASALVITQQPTQTAAGAAITPAVGVAIRDAYGNTVTGSSAQVSVALLNNPGGATLSGTATVNAASGVASFSTLTLNRSGTGYTLRASSTGLTSADTAAFDILPGAASRLVFIQSPSNAQVGVAIAPAITVEVQDGSGNRVTSPALSIEMAIGTNPGGGSLTGTTPRTTVSGVATFGDLALSAAGTGYTLVASSGVVTPATSAAFNITTLPSSGLAYTDPPAGGKIRLVRNAGLSTSSTVVLDLVAAQTLTGYAVGFNLPLDTTRVQANGALIETGTVLNPGSAPAAIMASLPATGPLASVLVTGQSQKATGTGAISSDSVVASGALFYRIRLDAKAGATAGVVFDGTSLGAQFLGLMRDKSGTDVATNGDFRIGRLDFL
ncbi:MAG: hypothetical protein M3Y59_02385 [Myxococcota bacterium]|nr:hypothetical protein [Myxococcota bacterium]